MSKNLVLSSNSEQIFPKFYIYKLTFNSGATYIGQHTQYKENDNYITSSCYYWKMLQNNNDFLLKREILFYVPTKEQMDIMETICIISDKMNNDKNVNGNFGPWRGGNCAGWNKGLKMPKEFGEKISKSLEINKEERNKKVSESLKGKPKSEEWKIKAKLAWTEERKEKQSKWTKENKPWLGMTEETKKQISETLKEKYSSGEILHPQLGVQRTEEQKNKQSQTMKQKYDSGEITPWNKGKTNIYSEEVKKKLSEAWKGKKLSEEHKINILKGNKRRKRVLQKSTGKIFDSMRQCERETGCDRCAISQGYYPDLEILD